MKSIEKAIYFFDLAGIKNIEEYDRLYFGSEFCVLHFPSATEFDYIIGLAKEKNKKVTLLTPLCDTQTIDFVRGILLSRYEMLKAVDFEVVINDYGMLSMLQLFPDIKKVAGRDFFRYKKDPRIRKLDNIPKEYSYNMVNSESVKEFCKKYSICRIEFDNVDYLLEGLNNNELSYSVYYPYVKLTTTKMCRFQDDNLYSKFNGLSVTTKCDRKCDKCVLELENNALDTSIFVRGNTQYYYTEEKSIEWYHERGISRIVYDKMLPVDNKVVSLK